MANSNIKEKIDYKGNLIVEYNDGRISSKFHDEISGDNWMYDAKNIEDAKKFIDKKIDKYKEEKEKNFRMFRNREESDPNQNIIEHQLIIHARIVSLIEKCRTSSRNEIEWDYEAIKELYKEIPHVIDWHLMEIEDTHKRECNYMNAYLKQKNL